MSVCLSLASDSLETVEVIIVKLCTMSTSDMRMLHVFARTSNILLDLIILTLSFILGHTDLNHVNKCVIIS